MDEERCFVPRRVRVARRTDTRPHDVCEADAEPGESMFKAADRLYGEVVGQKDWERLEVVSEEYTRDGTRRSIASTHEKLRPLVHADPDRPMLIAPQLQRPKPNLRRMRFLDGALRSPPFEGHRRASYSPHQSLGFRAHLLRGANSSNARARQHHRQKENAKQDDTVVSLSAASNRTYVEEVTKPHFARSKKWKRKAAILLSERVKKQKRKQRRRGAVEVDPRRGLEPRINKQRK